MLKVRLTSAVLFAGTVAFGSAGSLSAQDVNVNLRPIAESNAADRAQAQRLSAILKSKVIIQEDRPAGEIVDIVMTDGGCVEYVVASYEDRYYAIPYTATQVRYADRVVYVDMAPAQFDRVQFFAPNAWPTFDAPYRRNVYQTFGVNIDVEGDRRRNTTLKRRLDDDRPNNNRDQNRREGDRPNSDRKENDRREGVRPNNNRPASDRNDRQDADDRPERPLTPINPERKEATPEKAEQPKAPRSPAAPAAPTPACRPCRPRSP